MDVWYSLVTYMKTIHYLPIKSQPVLEANNIPVGLGRLQKIFHGFFAVVFLHSTPRKKASTSHVVPVTIVGLAGRVPMPIPTVKVVNLDEIYPPQ